MIRVPRKKQISRSQKPAENWVRGLLLLYALGLMLWLIGRDLTGDQFLPIRWTGFIAPWLLYATITMALYSAIKKRWVPVAALLFALAFTFNLTPSTSNHSNVQNQSSGTGLSVLSFNIGYFNRQYKNIADLIADNPADLIFLQEVSLPKILTRELAAKQFGTNFYQHIDKKTGLVILSRTPIISVNRLRGVLTNYKIAHPTGTISLWNIHVPRSIWSDKQKSKTIANLLQDIERHPGPKIIAGDFNLTPYNDGIRKIYAKLNGAKIAPKSLFTYPTPIRIAGRIGPWVEIDHILTSQHFHRHDFKRIKNYAGSDHYPILVQLKLRGNAYTGLGNTGAERPGAG